MHDFVKYPLYLITGKPEEDLEKFLELLKVSLVSGVKLVQIRAKSLSVEDYTVLATEAVKLCHQYSAKAILNNHIDLLDITGADGIHLSSQALMQISKRPCSSNILFSAACHDKEQIMHAKMVGADLILLSPVFSTPSSPQGKPLGWEKFSDLAKSIDIPVYALGGMTPGHLFLAKNHGAVGIAAIRSMWGL
jgi:thiamine-phosphate diphosphorylase